MSQSAITYVGIIPASVEFFAAQRGAVVSDRVRAPGATSRDLSDLPNLLTYTSTPGKEEGE